MASKSELAGVAAAAAAELRVSGEGKGDGK